MNALTHSPGPWEWVGNCLESKAPGHYESVLEAKVSCGQFCYGGSVELTISDADKKLIEACPDLLMILEIIAADDDAARPARRPPRRMSGRRQGRAPARINAAPKAAPTAVRHVTTAGGA